MAIRTKFREAIRTLLDDPGLNAIIGRRIYAEKFPDVCIYPAVCMMTDTRTVHNTIEGKLTITQTTQEFHIWGYGEDQVEEIRHYLLKLLPGGKRNVQVDSDTTVTITGVNPTEVDQLTDQEHEDNPELRHYELDLEFWYKEDFS